MEEGSFKVKKFTKIDDFLENQEIVIPESDITIQHNGYIIQLEHTESEEDEEKFVIKPGCHVIESSMEGTKLKKYELKKYELLETVDNTSQIIGEGDKFFSKLDIYEMLKREPKRAILIASPPGVGKTAAINKVCTKYMSEDEGTCVVIWDTSDVESSDVNKFFLRKSEFDKSVKRLILVMEDIGGGTVEDSYGARGADSSLLNLLDGVGNPFKGVPTFIIATTNNPEQSVGALIDRPGRFDKVVELDTPNEEECVQLIKFISKKEDSLEVKEAAKIAAKSKFSIAHLQEIVVRSLLDDITYVEAAVQLREHKERVKRGFEEEKSMGLGF